MTHRTQKYSLISHWLPPSNSSIFVHLCYEAVQQVRQWIWSLCGLSLHVNQVSQWVVPYWYSTFFSLPRDMNIRNDMPNTYYLFLLYTVYCYWKTYSSYNVQTTSSDSRGKEKWKTDIIKYVNLWAHANAKFCFRGLLTVDTSVCDVAFFTLLHRC